MKYALKIQVPRALLEDEAAAALHLQKRIGYACRADNENRGQLLMLKSGLEIFVLGHGVLQNCWKTDGEGCKYLDVPDAPWCMVVMKYERVGAVTGGVAFA